MTTLVALVPVLIATGRGADVAKAMAWPVFGGMVVELVTLFVVPVLYCSYQETLLAVRVAESRDETDMRLYSSLPPGGGMAASPARLFREE